MDAHDASPPSSDAPDVSVLMPVYNGERYLESAVRSVMDQTLRSIEIVIVDDGSSDGTAAILDRLASEDGRIRVEPMSRNVGLSAALNHGLGVVRGALVARMDADDLAEPERLEVQKRFLDEHADVVLLGAGVRYIDEHGADLRTTHRPRDPFASRWLQRFELPLIHPTFMFRRRLIDEAGIRYDPDVHLNEDYDFCSQALRTGEVANLPDTLLRFRLHGGSVSRQKWTQQVNEAGRVAKAYHEETLGPEIANALAPFRDAYFEFRPVDAVASRTMFEGFRRMIAEDARKAPERRAWMMRQGAQRIMKALDRSGAGKSGTAAAFLRDGRDFLIPLALRFLELRGALPASMRTDPKVW